MGFAPKKWTNLGIGLAVLSTTSLVACGPFLLPKAPVLASEAKAVRQAKLERQAKPEKQVMVIQARCPVICGSPS